MKVGVVGTGHVGLPTAAALAHIGHEVVAMDADTEKIRALERGTMPFYEPGMAELVEQGVAEGRLRFSTRPEDVVAGARIVFLCVGTPPRSSGEANLLAIERAAAMIAEHATEEFVLVQKSTVPSGTAGRLIEAMTRYRSKVSFSVVSNPEFLREGNAIGDSLNPSRILVGSDSPGALAVLKELYQPLIDDGAPWIATDVKTAEMAKHASNAFLATKISFANALARLCEASGADVVAVVEAMGSDPRIGRAFLDAGLGYGGYCFPKDLAAFDALATKLGYDFALLREVAKINDEAVTTTFKKIEDAMWNLEEKKVALLGLSFKPGTDDTRFSPALRLGRLLIDGGARVVGFDPAAGTHAKSELEGLEVVSDPYDAAEEAHCLVICTEWAEFRDIDLQRLHSVMAFPVVVDGRNIFDPATMAAAGFTYLPTGRPSVDMGGGGV